MDLPTWTSERNGASVNSTLRTPRHQGSPTSTYLLDLQEAQGLCKFTSQLEAQFCRSINTKAFVCLLGNEGSPRNVWPAQSGQPQGMICMTLSFVGAVVKAIPVYWWGSCRKTGQPMPCHVSFVAQRPFLRRPRVLESLKQTVVEYDWQGSLPGGCSVQDAPVCWWRLQKN